MAYGYIQTAGNVARQLKELNRDYYGRKTWGSLYGAVDLQRKNTLEGLTYDYDSQVAKAYATAYQQKSAIANSALGSGFKQQGQLDVDAALQEAFNTYRQDYLSSAAQVENTAFEATSQIDALLQQEAQNYVDYGASAYSYLQYLYDRAYPGENANYDADADLVKMFAEDPNWSKYIITSEDEFKNKTSRLMTEQELRERNYDLDASGQGTINKTGVDFYDQMLNQLSQEGSNYGFHEWLSKENPELYEWSQSGDAYSYTEAGTKMGTFKKMMGLKSTDDEYKFIERFGGMSEQDVKDNVQSFSTDVSNIVNTGHHKDTKSALDTYSTALTNLSDYANKLNLSPEQKEAVNSAITTMQNTISSADIKDTSDWQAWAEVVDVVKDEWEYAEYHWSKGEVGNAALDVGSLVFNAVLTFGLSTIMDLGHVLFPKSAEALTNAFGRDIYKDRQTERITSNKETVYNIEQQYLDLITLLASYAK